MQKLNIILFLTITPLITFGAFEDIKTMAGELTETINILIIVLVAVAVVVFLYGLVQLLTKAGGDKDMVIRAKNTIGWGLALIFIMVSLWGIILLMQSLFGFGNGQPLYDDQLDPNSVPGYPDNRII